MEWVKLDVAVGLKAGLNGVGLYCVVNDVVCSTVLAVV